MWGRVGFHSSASTTGGFHFYSVLLWVIAALCPQAGLSRKRTVPCLVVIAGYWLGRDPTVIKPLCFPLSLPPSPPAQLLQDIGFSRFCWDLQRAVWWVCRPWTAASPTLRTKARESQGRCLWTDTMDTAETMNWTPINGWNFKSSWAPLIHNTFEFQVLRGGAWSLLWGFELWLFQEALWLGCRAHCHSCKRTQWSKKDMML